MKAEIDDDIIMELGEFFRVFGDSTRIKLLYCLAERELNVGDLTDALKMSQSSVSHQLRILRQAGLVKNRKDGKTVCYSLDDEHVEALLRQGLDHILHKKGE